MDKLKSKMMPAEQLSPGKLPLGSVESRAAARAMAQKIRDSEECWHVVVRALGEPAATGTIDEFYSYPRSQKVVQVIRNGVVTVDDKIDDLLKRAEQRRQAMQGASNL